ncbi:oxidoreductase [Leekyejoonella antrihumi]|uniref:Oxidoreductase n=2 Tax=Leekyejoonella antrihumi TaxID=1660198 RepID=A0A563E2I0_9MICO|nr:oxidoreductase [Leekyejoonella antrihumi]
MAIGHLVAAVTDPAASPVLAVGSAVINRTPTPLKDWAISHFGTHDKLILLSSVSVATLVLAGATGLIYRRTRIGGLLAQLVLVVVAGLALLTLPTLGVRNLGPTVVTEIVAAAVLVGLPRAGAVGRRFSAPDSAVSNAGNTRRAFLAGAGGVAVVAAGSAVLGNRLGQAPDTSKIALPTAADPLPTLPAGLERKYRGISPLRTPNSSFYRVDTNLTVPNVRQDTWSLRVDGDVDHPFTLTYEDLLRMPLVERDITMTCVSNAVGGSYVGAARWLGVRVSDLLKRAGVQEPDRPGRQVLSTSVDGFTISTPLGALTDNRDALLAIGMNGEALPRKHGFPARLVTPGLYGMVGSTKWVTRLHVTTYPEAKAYWTNRGWATDAKIKPSARIDTPSPLAQLDKGSVIVGGVAWAQQEGVVRVQVKIDDEAWQGAALGPDVNVDYWRQWYFVWHASKSGEHTLQSRVVYGDGTVQTAERVPVFPDGSSGIQNLVVTVK